MGRSILSCKDVSALICRALEDRLPFADRMKIRAHLLFCEACKRFSSQVRFLEKAMAISFREGPSREEGVPDLSPEARERILRSVREGRDS